MNRYLILLACCLLCCGLRIVGQIVAPSEDGGQAFVRQLTAADAEVRVTAINSLATLSNRDYCPRLLRLLNDDAAEVRAAAINALGDLYYPPAWPNFVKLSRDGDPLVRVAATQALGQTSFTSAGRPIMKCLLDDDVRVQVAAIGALAAFHDTTAVNQLLNSLRNPHYEVRKAVVLALQQYLEEQHLNTFRAIALQPPTDVPAIMTQQAMRISTIRGALISAIDDPDLHVQHAAAVALYWMHHPQATTTRLLDAGNDDDPTINIPASWMAKLPWQSLAYTEQLIALFQAEKDSTIRKSLLCAVAQLPDERAVDILLAALQNTDKQVQQLAIGYLGERGETRAVTPLLSTLAQAPWQLRCQIVRTLGQINNPQTLDALLTALKDRELPVRITALRGLHTLHDQRIVDVCVPLLNDRDVTIREQAVFLLAEYGQKSVLPYLKDYLLNPDPDIQLQTVNALANYKDPEALDLLLTVSNIKSPAMANAYYTSLIKFSDLRVTNQFIEVFRGDNPMLQLAAMNALGSQGHTMKDWIVAMTLKPDVRVRRNAVQVFSTLVDDTDIPVLNVLLKDTDVQVRRLVLLQCVTRLQPTESSAILRQELQHDPDMTLRAAAARTLGNLHDQLAIEPLLSALESPNTALSQTAQQALTSITGQRFGRNIAQWRQWWDMTKQKEIQ